MFYIGVIEEIGEFFIKMLEEVVYLGKVIVEKFGVDMFQVDVILVLVFFLSFIFFIFYCNRELN